MARLTGMRSRTSLGVFVVAAITLSGCAPSIELPAERADFAARWSYGPNFFAISLAGEVNLELNGPSSTIFIQHGSLCSFDGTAIEVGLGHCWRPDRISISQSPYETPRGAAIRVEGFELYREQLARD